MSYFPINVDIDNRDCTVIGGGKVAERKVKGLLACHGRVKVISPEVTPTLADMAARSIIKWQARGFVKGDLADSFLVIAATDDEGVQEKVYKEAQEGNILLNVADVPKWCNFILPASLRRGDLTITISTAGKSPALARRTRQRLEADFGQEYDLALQLMGALRPLVLALGRPHAENKIVFEKLLHPDLLVWLKEADWQQIKDHLTEILNDEQQAHALVDTVRNAAHLE